MESTPGHVELARQLVINALDGTQIKQLHVTTQAVLENLDPDGSLAVTYRRCDTTSDQLCDATPSLAIVNRQVHFIT